MTAANGADDQDDLPMVRLFVKIVRLFFLFLFPFFFSFLLGNKK
jgi:hypothetical protein